MARSLGLPGVQVGLMMISMITLGEREYTEEVGDRDQERLATYLIEVS